MVAFSAVLHVALACDRARLAAMDHAPADADRRVHRRDHRSERARRPASSGPIRAEPVASVAQPERREEPQARAAEARRKGGEAAGRRRRSRARSPSRRSQSPSPSPRSRRPRQSRRRRKLAKIERDKDIQEAIKRLGEKGASKKAGGLGGTEEAKRAALGSGGEGGGGGVLTGLDFIIYKNQVEGLIKRNWTWVGANPDLTIRVGFRIGDDGQIGDLRVIDRSGDSSFDDSVMRAIRISSPLPAPPAKYREVFADYVLEFVSGELAAGG